MRLIDADKLEYWEIDEIGGEYSPYMGCSKEYIDEQPTVQAIPIEVLQEIRQEIEKPLRDERCFDTADAKAQYIALNWVCELIDKHIKESDDEWDRVTMIDVDGNTHNVTFKKEIEDR